MKTLYEEHIITLHLLHSHLTEHLLISRMVIPKEDALFKTRPKPKVNVSCVGLVYFQSLVGLRLLLVVYLMN